VKVLYIDNYKYTYNKRIHCDSILELGKICNLVTVGNYIGGKNNYKIEEIYDIINIISKEKPDCILTYNPGEGNCRRLSNLCNILNCISIPKFHISTDYGRFKMEKAEFDWFDKNGYTAAFFRHKKSMTYPCTIPKYNLPFSVDHLQWGKYRNVQKKDTIGFVGAFNNNEKVEKLYQKRISASNFFSDNKIMNNVSKDTVKKLYGEDYCKFISSNAFGLTCGGTCNFLVAKHFEIPASGGILICDGEAEGLEEFPPNSYIKYGGENMVEILSIIKNFNENKYVRRMFAEKLENYIYERCKHIDRAKYLLECISNHI
jgi:hypothetical protein